MKIGVSGASGQVGKAVLAELKKRGTGHAAIGISRVPESVAAPAEARRGDYDHPDSLIQAYAGLDRLLIIPSSELAPGVRARQIMAAIDAAVKAGVGHIVLLSAAGTREAAEPALGAAYWAGEQHLIKTAPRWTILRMNYYAELIADEIKSALGIGMLTGLGEERVAFISRDDVAAAAVGILLGEGHSGAIYTATGTDVVTGANRAALVSEITGTPIGFAVIPEEQLRGGLAQAGLPAPVVDVLVEIKTIFVAGYLDIVTGDVERLSGRPPRPLRDILKSALA